MRVIFALYSVYNWRIKFSILGNLHLLIFVNGDLTYKEEGLTIYLTIGIQKLASLWVGPKFTHCLRDADHLQWLATCLKIQQKEKVRIANIFYAQFDS